MGGQFTGANRIVAVKTETTPGTYIQPLPSDYDIEFYDASALSFERNPARFGKPASGNLMQGRSMSGMENVTGYALKCALKHSGNATQLPKLDKLFMSAGLWRDPLAGPYIEYFYDGTQPCQTLSVEVTEFNCGRNPDAITSRARGGVTNMVINGPGIGEQLDCTFELSAAYQEDVDNLSATRVLSSAQDEGAAERLLNTLFTIDGSSVFCLHNFNLNLNNEVADIGDPSKPGGLYQYKVVGADPVLTASVQQLSLSESQIMDYLAHEADADNTQVTITGRAFAIVIEKSRLRNMTVGDRNGVNTNELEFEVRGFRLKLLSPAGVGGQEP